MMCEAQGKVSEAQEEGIKEREWGHILCTGGTWLFAGKPAQMCRQAERRWETLMDDYLSFDMFFLPRAKNGQDGPVLPLCCHDNHRAEWMVCRGRQHYVIAWEVVRAKAQVKQSRGWQEATCLHYLTSGCPDVVVKKQMLYADTTYSSSCFSGYKSVLQSSTWSVHTLVF